MRKILSLLTAILFAGSMMAADPVEIASSTFNGSAGTHAEGWSTTGTGVSRSDCVIIGAGENITSPEVDLSNYESITVQINSRRYGSLSGKKADIAVTFDGEAIGTVSAAGTSATTALDPIEYTVNGLSTGNFVFTCTNATSAGSSHGAGINSIVITGIEKSGEGGDEQEGTVKTVYCKVTQGWWTADGAATGIYAYADGNVENAAWPGVRMEAVEGEEGLWKADIDTAVYHNIIFTRFNPSDEGDQDWGAKTGDLQIPADKDLYTITSETAVWGDPGVTGEWSVYVAPVPVENVTIYYVNTNEWETVNAFVWPETGNAYKEWTGEAMTKSENQIHGFDVYSYTFPENYVNIIFNNGDEQTENLTWNTAKPYFYDGKWYESADKIPAPAVPVEGNIWKAVASTPVIAGSHYIDEELIKMDGYYATTLKANARTIAGEEFTHAIQVRTDGYPSATNVIGAEKSGSTPLIITAKENIEVTFYYNRQVVGEGGTCNDNKDMIVFDQAAPTVKMEGDFVIDQVLEGNNYLNATKKVMLEKDHVYTVTASGTTIQLHGVKFGIPVPHYYIAGSMTDWAEHMAELLPLEEKADSLGIAINLEADSLYAFKVVRVQGTDTAWYGLGGEGTMTYGNSEGWWIYKSEGDNNQANVGLMTTKAAEYPFVVKVADDHMEVSVAIPVRYYAKYNVGEDWAWSMMAEKEGKWIADSVVYRGGGANVYFAEDNDHAWYFNESGEDAFKKLNAYEGLAVLDTVQFIFNPADTTLAVALLGKYPTVSVMVRMGEEFVEMPFALSEDKASASMTANIAKGEYEFKLVVNGEERGNGFGLNRDEYIVEGITEYLDNMYFEADMKGDYTFTWTFENNALAITYPDPIHYYIAGSMTDWTEHMAELTPRGGKEDSLGGSVRLLEDSLYEYKIVRVQGTDTTWYGLGEAATMEYGNSNGWWIFKSENDQNQANVGLQASTKANYLFTVLIREDHLEVSVVIPKPFPSMKIAGEWDIDEGDWVIKPMELAADSLTASYDVDLEAGEYEFKMIKSGKWLTKANDGAFGLHREFPGVAGVVDEAENNLKLTADFAGTYVFTWTFANDSIGIEFPEIPAPHYYIAGSMTDWDLNMEELLPLEEKADSLGVTLNLDADSLYLYKIVRVQGTDTAWYGLGEYAAMTYGNNEGWWVYKSEGDNNQANVGLQTTKEAAYPFVVKVADGHMEVSVVIPEPEAKLPVVGLGANFNGWNWLENLFILAEDSLSASIKVDLGVTDTIQFKVVSDGSWLSLNGEGESLYGLHRNWPKAEHVNLINDGRNFSLATDVAGEYTFTWTYADSTLVVTFPAAPAQPKFKIAGSMTDWAPSIEVFEDSYTFENLAAGSYKFKVVVGDWIGFDALTAETRAAELYKDQDGNVCFVLAEAGNVTVTYTEEVFKVEGAFVPALVQLIGINGWTAETDAINMTPAEDHLSASVTLNLTGWWYEFKVLLEGAWLGKEHGDEGKYTIHNGWNHVEGLTYAGDNIVLSMGDGDIVPGSYTFTYEYATGQLTVTFPTDPTALDEIMAAGKAVKIVRNGQILIIKGEKIFNAQGQLVK